MAALDSPNVPTPDSVYFRGYRGLCPLWLGIVPPRHNDG